MQPVYSRIHRLSIYEPATIHDFPFEVLENCLKYLIPSDLVAPSLACSAWHPAATGLMYYHVKLCDKDQEWLGRFVCGLHLRNVVFGAGSCKIKRLDVDFNLIESKYFPLIAQLVSPLLSTLKLDFGHTDEGERDYEILDIFLSQCLRLRNLSLVRFYFCDDLSAITTTIKDGFARLRQFDLIGCEGDVSMFVDQIPISNLQFLIYRSNLEPGQNIYNLAMEYRSLTIVMLQANFESSSSLLKIVECCRSLKEITLNQVRGNPLELIKSDFESIASLPYLKLIQIDGCVMSEVAVAPLTRCKGLTRLYLDMDFALLRAILSVIGIRIAGMDLRRMSAEAVDGILKYCPNLESLYFVEPNPDIDIQASLEQKLNIGLKRLNFLEVKEVNQVRVRLGTDWMGMVRSSHCFNFIYSQVKYRVNDRGSIIKLVYFFSCCCVVVVWTQMYISHRVLMTF
jgi:hypothetical protein